MELFREKMSAFNTVQFLRNFCRMLSSEFLPTLLLTIDNSQISFWLPNYVTFFFSFFSIRR